MLSTADTRVLHAQQVEEYIRETADDLWTTGQALCAIPSQRAREEGKKLMAAGGILQRLAVRQQARDSQVGETPGGQPGATRPTAPPEKEDAA